MKIETKLKNKYKNHEVEVYEYMVALIDQLVFEYGEINPSWELSLDMISDWYSVYISARNSIKEKGVSWIDANGNIHKNPDLSSLSNATNVIQSMLRSFAANPYQKSKMKAFDKDIHDSSQYVMSIMEN